MIGPSTFRPLTNYGRSLMQGGALGGCVGSVYVAILASILIPESRLIAFALVMCVATGLSVPVLYWLSAVSEQFLTPLLTRIHRGRFAVFTIAGGCLGIVIGMLLVTAWFLLQRPIRRPDFEELIGCMIVITIPFAYGAASGAFTALAMGTLDRKYMDQTPSGD